MPMQISRTKAAIYVLFFTITGFFSNIVAAENYTNIYSCYGYGKDDQTIKHLLDIGFNKQNHVTYFSYRSINDLGRTCHLQSELGETDTLFDIHSKWENSQDSMHVTKYMGSDILYEVTITKLESSEYEIIIPNHIKPNKLCGVSATISRKTIIQLGNTQCKVMGDLARYDD